MNIDVNIFKNYGSVCDKSTRVYDNRYVVSSNTVSIFDGAFLNQIVATTGDITAFASNGNSEIVVFIDKQGFRIYKADLKCSMLVLKVSKILSRVTACVMLNDKICFALKRDIYTFEISDGKLMKWRSLPKYFRVVEMFVVNDCIGLLVYEQNNNVHVFQVLNEDGVIACQLPFFEKVVKISVFDKFAYAIFESGTARVYCMSSLSSKLELCAECTFPDKSYRNTFMHMGRIYLHFNEHIQIYQHSNLEFVHILDIQLAFDVSNIIVYPEVMYIFCLDNKFYAVETNYENLGVQCKKDRKAIRLVSNEYHKLRIFKLAHNRSETCIVSASRDRIIVWSSEPKGLTYRFSIRCTKCKDIYIWADRLIILDKIVEIVSLDTGDVLHTIDVMFRAFSVLDAELIAYDGSQITIYNIDDNPIVTWNTPVDIKAISGVYCDKMNVYACVNNCIHVFIRGRHINTGDSVKAILFGHKLKIRALSITDSNIISFGEDMLVKVWSKQTEQCINTFKENINTLIVQGDSDFTVLTNSQVKMYTNFQNTGFFHANNYNYMMKSGNQYILARENYLSLFTPDCSETSTVSAVNGNLCGLPDLDKEKIDEHVISAEFFEDSKMEVIMACISRIADDNMDILVDELGILSSYNPVLAINIINTIFLEYPTVLRRNNALSNVIKECIPRVREFRECISLNLVDIMDI